MEDNRVLLPQQMILTKDNFSSVGFDTVSASAGSIYKLLLVHNYSIESKETTPTIRYLVKNNEVMASVDINDIIYYLHTNNTTYKLYSNRIEKALKSKYEYKKEHAVEYVNILKQLQEIYIAKYLFKQLPYSIRLEYVKNK